MSTAIVWLRRDLRLADNPALDHACRAHQYVVVLYVLAEHEAAPWQAGAASRVWLHHSLRALAGALGERGGCLVLRRGDSLAVLQALVAETQAGAVYWNRGYEPALSARDADIKRALRAAGLEAHSFPASLLNEPWDVRTGNGDPYRVFTPYWKSVSRRPVAAPHPAPLTVPAPLRRPRSEALDDWPLLPRIPWAAGIEAAWNPGEAGARGRLLEFLDEGLFDYADARNLPAAPAVSRLSPHLHFGEISPRQVWWAVANRCGGQPLESRGGEAFLRELGWREFAAHVLWHHPDSPQRPLQARFDAYPWAEDYAPALAAWQQGRTGYPLVDAGMRELWTTGWMHNRVRMLCASFLVKNLRIPWQEGARWFWDTLVDADLASNTLGWQWTAGCGVDAAPYFRVFSPLRQGEQFDAGGDYVRRWLPELKAVPTKYIHAPWTLPAAETARCGFKPGAGYPLPIVDFASSRAQALAGFERIKGERGLSA